MPWFLRNKINTAYKGLVVISFITMCFLQLYVLAALIIVVVWLNKKVVRCIEEPMKYLGPKRKVKKIDTLVIGDLCSEKFLNKYYNPNSSIVITAPGRSLTASAEILAHVETILCEHGKVIIVEPKRETSHPITIFDLPVLSLITSLEFGYSRKSFVNRRIPLFRSPVRSLQMILGSRARRERTDCPNESINALCKRKGFLLIFLV